MILVCRVVVVSVHITTLCGSGRVVVVSVHVTTLCGFGGVVVVSVHVTTLCGSGGVVVSVHVTTLCGSGLSCRCGQCTRNDTVWFWSVVSLWSVYT